jgi:hypothetical protein
VQGIGASSVLINPRHAFAFGAAVASGLLLLQLMRTGANRSS